MNSVRKLDGEVGELAKSLVNKWKETVSDAEKVEKLKPPVPLFSESRRVTLAAPNANLSCLSSDLPIKLEPADSSDDFFFSPPREHLGKSSSSSSDSSRHKPKSDHHSSRNGHSSRDKDEKKPKSDDTKHHKSHRSSHGESSSSKRKHAEASTESKENNSSHKKPKLERDIKEEPKASGSGHQHRTSSNPKESPSKEKSNKRSKREVVNTVDEMDGSGSVGFAEALAMFDMPSSSKKKDLSMADKIVKVPSKSSSKNEKKPSSSSSSSSKKEEIKKTLHTLKELTAPPKLLMQKPSKLPTLPDIVSDLPSDVSIPEYRPALLNSAVKDYINTSVHGSASSYNCRPPQKHMSDAELLTESFSSKANRTRVFSGNRVQRAVPKLFDMCIRVLQENIEFLECTGGVPFDILRPVLERAKPEQLSNIEYFNSYLLDDSDVLWEPHCKRKFRTRKREEMESWRDMYERCTREDEEKLSRLTQNIKQNQETTSNGVQKTMMAFVDGLAKPPRNVMRQQEIFGTNRKLVVSAAARTEGLRNIAPNLAVAGDVRLRVASGIRDDAQNG